jgi:shikimate kinase
MMGAGKSTVGRKLASRLGRRFVDADAEIERAAGRSVPEIFASEGEASFRNRELSAVQGLLGSGAVVALGGGAVTQSSIRQAIAGSGTVIYLRAAPETLLERVGDAGSRPLLAGLGPQERLLRLQELLADREAAYAEADLCIDTDSLDPGELVERLVGSLEPAATPSLRRPGVPR